MNNISELKNTIVEKDRTIPAIDQFLDEIYCGIIERRIDFGCGKNKRPGYIGVDIFMDEKVDVVCNVDKEPLPFDMDSISIIRAVHSIEHIKDPIKLFNQFYMICKNGAYIYIVVPHPASPYYFQDPTHKSFYTEQTFQKYFDGEYVNSYSDYGFKGKIIPEIVLLQGKDFMHLSIHALMKVVK